MSGCAAVIASAVAWRRVGVLLETEWRTVSGALQIWVVALQCRRRQLCGARPASEQEDVQISLGGEPHNNLKMSTPAMRCWSERP